MLLILYGGIGEMGMKSREYLEQAGFQTMKKYNYAPAAPALTTKFGTRNYVSEEEFLEKTDSLFRYEVGGIQVGFHQQQISDAVCGRTNSLLSLSTKDSKFLAQLKEIKRIYAEQVCAIYVYIDDDTLRRIIAALPGITEEEAKVRFETGKGVKQSYLRHQELFDHVVIYGGEESEFSYKSLFSQYDRIVASLELGKPEERRYADVFISYTRKDRNVFEALKTAFGQKGISVFDESQFAVQEEWMSAVSDAIQHAKIVVPVITGHALASKWILTETEYAVRCAKKNGTRILPLIAESVELGAHPSLECILRHLSGVRLHNDLVHEAAEKLAEQVRSMLSAEANLKTYSRQVDSCLQLKMFDQAKHWQEAHLKLCDALYKNAEGAFLDLEACLMSRVKLIGILLEMGLYETALDHIVEALNYRSDGDTYDLLADQFALCCVHLHLEEAQVRELAKKRLKVFAQHADSEWDALAERFRIIQKRRLEQSVQPAGETPMADDESRIAQYGELAIGLFADWIQKEAQGMSRHDLILGYERILNYCKHVGLKGEVADQCIRRIAELSAYEETPQAGEGSVAAEALKIYLGQAMPQSGQYDVFLSYKSEDEALARKVFDYLSQSGKEVFFAKETLPQLGRSKYEQMIFEAIDRSRHMVLIGSNPDYFKTSWVNDEWSTFNNEIREGRKNGNLVLLLTDDIAAEKGRLPPQLRQKEIVRMSEFRGRLLSYLR